MDLVFVMDDSFGEKERERDGRERKWRRAW